MLGKYKKYYPIIEKKRNIFEKLIEKIKISKTLEKKLYYAEIALKFAVKQPTGYYTSSFLENFYLEYAKTLKFSNNNQEYKKNTFLHVLTSGYNSGGHTRVIERWIENAPISQEHSVVVLKPVNELSILEKNIKEKNGNYILFEKNIDLATRALKLRELALNYEYIILHTHMDDPTAVVAFGIEKFERPVIFYNHSAHLFWIGKSIADIVLDVVKDNEITQKQRNIKNSFFVGIPAFITKKNIISKEEARKKTKIPNNKKIILSTASNLKYSPIGNDNFYNLVKDLLDENTYCYVIGPSLKEKLWKKYYKKSKGHIIPLGTIGFNNGYLDYVASADLCIDSFPLNSGTALMDAISSNIPSLSMKCAMYMLDYLKNTHGFCLNKNDFENRAKNILNDKNYAKNLLMEEQKSLFEMQSVNAWNKRIEEMLKIVPKKHSIKDLSNENDYKEINDLCVLNHFCNTDNMKINFLSKFIFLFKYLIYKLSKNIQKEIKYYILVQKFW
ncbi:TPA: hypothetical protein CPU00_13000 [Candidatus Gastranaerophilales bacterium HUM_18]|nr:MAG TPA: hypothetical protein CPU00_13000 [Candidatus Gastranaerophilales bacterium HUM_18]